MTRRSRTAVSRDQAVSPFSVVLQRLCDSVPAFAAAFVDPEGETVDYAGYLAPYETRILAAELQLVLAHCSRSPAAMLEGTREIVVRANEGSLAVYSIAEGYSLVLRLPRGAFTVSPRALGDAVRELCLEGGLSSSTPFPYSGWARVEVREDNPRHRRPASIHYGGVWQSVSVLGRHYADDLLARETAYRVRLDNGLETMLVRERLGHWFADQVSRRT